MNLSSSDSRPEFATHTGISRFRSTANWAPFFLDSTPTVYLLPARPQSICHLKINSPGPITVLLSVLSSPPLSCLSFVLDATIAFCSPLAFVHTFLIDNSAPSSQLKTSEPNFPFPHSSLLWSPKLFLRDLSRRSQGWKNVTYLVEAGASCTHVLITFGSI